MLTTRTITLILVAVLFVNFTYFIGAYRQEEARLNILKFEDLKAQKIKNLVLDDQIPYPKDVEYDLLEPKEKVAYLLDQVQHNADGKYDATNTSVKHPFAQIEPQNYGQDGLLTYDPRITLSVYLEEIKHQLETENPQNDPWYHYNISVPFSWADWVDLTALNTELVKSDEDKLDCAWLQSTVNKPTNNPDFCKDLRLLSEAEFEEIGLTEDDLPGFIVKQSPFNKIPNLQSIMQAKSHLLTYAELPLQLIFLTQNGTYDVPVRNERASMMKSGMFKTYFERTNRSMNQTHQIGPVEEMAELESTVPSRLQPQNVVYSKPSHSENSRELYLQPDMFHYDQHDVDSQIEYYEDIIQYGPEGEDDDYDDEEDEYDDGSSVEFGPDSDVQRRNTVELPSYMIKSDDEPIDTEEHPLNISSLENLTPQMLNHYLGLLTANAYTTANEPTYFKLSTLYRDEENKDNGWHYEWRFFNGANRYLKDDSWDLKQMEQREQIILDRLLRNWFKFCKEKGILSWISHGPLLSWYWDGFMFPYDIDVDIQMPISELNYLSRNYNMSLVIEDVEEGFGKYLIDCSTFLHHRDKPGRNNYIDARFIDVDSGVYIDITGLAKNNESPPHRYSSYIREKNSKGESIELYMDRRKHWYTFEQLSPLRLSMINGVPVYIPHDVMSMLNLEYSRGTTAYYFGGYYYVPKVRLWIKEEKIAKIFEESENGQKKIKRNKLISMIKKMTDEDKVRLLESDDELLSEYYLTQKLSSLHELEKSYLLDWSQHTSILDMSNITDYHQLTNRFELGKPLRSSMYDFEYYLRFDSA